MRPVVSLDCLCVPQPFRNFRLCVRSVFTLDSCCEMAAAVAGASGGSGGAGGGSDPPYPWRKPEVMDNLPPPPSEPEEEVVILLRMAAPHSCTTAGTGTTGEMKPGEGPKQTPPGRLADPRGQHPVEKYASPIPKARAIRYAGIGRGSQPLEIFNAPRIRETKLRDMKCRVNSRPGGRSKAGTPLQIGSRRKRKMTWQTSAVVNARSAARWSI